MIVRRSIDVALLADVNRAQRTARTIATEIGFDEKAAEEIALVASELASNLIKHAGGGTLTFIPLAGPTGIEIESLDSGPGIPDLERFIADGISTVGSLGYGLGTVNRLMDDLEATTPPSGRGLRLVVRRWIRPNTVPVRPFPLTFGVATRPYPGMAVNGDAFVLKRWEEKALVGIIDGLGHGPRAHEAAETARQYVETHFDQPLDALFRGTAIACSATRGVVMALARFDSAASTLTFGSVGNIEVRVFGSPDPISLMVRRGVIGLNAPPPIVTEHPWHSSNVMVLHSDGLRTHWRWEDFPELAGQPADKAAQRLLQALARDQDDATVIVVRGNLP